MKTIDRRKKMNFMIRVEIAEDLNKLVPSGERSDFVNGALEEALIDFSRKLAMEHMDRLREKLKWKISTKEIIRLKNYGRS